MRAVMQSSELLPLIVLYIDQNLNSKLTIMNIADQFHISEVNLHRIFKYAFDIPIMSYIRSKKIVKSVDILLKTNIKIIDIAYEFGFEYEQSFIRAFKRELNITPSEIRKNKKAV